MTTLDEALVVWVCGLDKKLKIEAIYIMVL